MPNHGKGSETVHLYVYWEVVTFNNGCLGKTTMAALRSMDLTLKRWIRWILWLLETLGTQSDAQMYMKVDNRTHKIK